MTNDFDLEPFRGYLRFLTASLLPAGLQGKVDASDIVQQTMLHAYQARAQYRGSNDAQLGAWLRTILANVLWGTLRPYDQDLSREQSIAAVEHSSARLETLMARDASSAASGHLAIGSRFETLMARDTSSPSPNMQRFELALRVANAFLELGEEERRAILLMYWHDGGFLGIAAELGGSPEDAARLVGRALRNVMRRTR